MSSAENPSCLNQVKIQDKYPEIKEIVAKMGRVADANGKDRLTIAYAALLHDVVEDTDYTVEDISNIFGAKVAQIVD